jgi:hypothetical protein
MAIGDNFAVMMGTASTDRQPASGVVEQVSAIVKPSAGDNVVQYDGALEMDLFVGAVQTSVPWGNTNSFRNMPYNMAIMIDNGTYLRKRLTTDRISAHGVQIDA